MHTHTHTHTHTHVRICPLSPPLYTQLLIPEETPLADDVDFERLARHEMSGGNVKSAVFRAASRAALRPDEDRKLAMQVLLQCFAHIQFTRFLKNSRMCSPPFYGVKTAKVYHPGVA